MDDGNGKLDCTLACPGSGGVDDMQVGCLWHGDHLVTVSLGGMICIFSARDTGKPPRSFSGHMKGINALSCFLQSGHRSILTTSYDGAIVRWVPGIGYGGKIHRKENTQIKCFSATERELLTSGFDNKVSHTKTLLSSSTCFNFFEPDIPSLSTTNNTKPFISLHGRHFIIMMIFILFCCNSNCRSEYISYFT